MKTFEVRVTRYYSEETIDMEIEASSEEEAKALALKEAEEKASQYFGDDAGEPSFDAEVNGD